MEQTKQPRDIRSLTMDELTELVASCKQPAFRAKQLAEWLFDKNVCSFDEMTNLPKSLRDQLAQRFTFGIPREAARQVSQDGSRKYLLQGCNKQVCYL